MSDNRIDRQALVAAFNSVSISDRHLDDESVQQHLTTAIEALSQLATVVEIADAKQTIKRSEEAIEKAGAKIRRLTGL